MSRLSQSFFGRSGTYLFISLMLSKAIHSHGLSLRTYQRVFNEKSPSCPYSSATSVFFSEGSQRWPLNYNLTQRNGGWKQKTGPGRGNSMREESPVVGKKRSSEGKWFGRFEVLRKNIKAFHCSNSSGYHWRILIRKTWSGFYLIWYFNCFTLW